MTSEIENNPNLSDSAKALGEMSTSYENTFPVGETVSREQILEGRRQMAEARVKSAHLLAPHDKKPKSPFTEISTSYENTFPVGEAITPAQAKAEDERWERARLKYAHLLEKP